MTIQTQKPEFNLATYHAQNMMLMLCGSQDFHPSPPCRNLQHESYMQAVLSAGRTAILAKPKDWRGEQHTKTDRIFQMSVMKKVSSKWWNIVPPWP